MKTISFIEVQISIKQIYTNVKSVNNNNNNKL